MLCRLLIIGIRGTVLVTQTYTPQQNTQQPTSYLVTMVQAFNNTIYPSFIQPVRICTLPKSINGLLDGKTFCFALIGKAEMKDAEQICTDLNARLPLPKDPTENQDFIKVIDRLGLSDFIGIQDESIILDLNYTSDPNQEQQDLLNPTKTNINTKERWLNSDFNQVLFQNWAYNSRKPKISGHQYGAIGTDYKWYSHFGNKTGTVVCQQELVNSKLLIFQIKN